MRKKKKKKIRNLIRKNAVYHISIVGALEALLISDANFNMIIVNLKLA